MKRLLLAFVISIASALPAATQSPLVEMTAIAGSPDRAAVTDLLLRYKGAGIDQALIYPRSGLEIEYMSERWMGFCRDFLEVADSLDMKVWLYDEYNWPSGSCKGEVTADGHEDLYPKMMVFDRSSDGSYTTRIVLNRTGADLLNPEAVARFIELTHERYYSEFGEYFGRVIPAIFTDEPSFSYTLTSAKGIQESNFTTFDKNHFGLAWYPGLEEDYARRYGRDFVSDVVSFLHDEDSKALWAGYYALVGDRMRETYVRPLSEWCESHGVHLTGHLQYEKLYKSVRCNGNILKSLSLFGLPGFDEANSDIDIDAREMEVSGLALAQYASRGKEGAICELYSVGPADLSLSIQRQLMWMCSSFGVNRYIVAVSAMDARGNRDKGDWYYSSGPVQPWFSYYREFSEEARKAAEFARKPFTPEVRVRVPSTYFASLDKTPDFERRGLVYLRFLEGLLRYQLQFMLLDEDEDPEGCPVMGYGPEGFHLEGESVFYKDWEAFLKHVTQVSPRRAVAYLEDGSEARNVLLRCWDDGNYTLVDLSDDDSSDRILTVRTAEGEGTVRLLGHGVFAGSLGDMKGTLPQAFACLEPITYSSKIPSSETVVRCLYTQKNPEFRFDLDSSVEDARLVLRTGIDPVKVRLDGRKIKAESPSQALPYSFNQNYKESRPLSLKAGSHVVSVKGGARDWRYLPGVFLVGSGDMSCYVGTYDINLDVDVPDVPGVSLLLNTNLACTEVLLDGKSLGRRAWGPFEWAVPAEFVGGRHRLTVRISTSVMPLFGDISKLEEEQPYAGWMRIRPGQHGNKARTGVYRLEWVVVQ